MYRPRGHSFLALTLLLAISAADAAETAGTVLALKGNCVAEPDKGAIALKVGDEVQVGETIATGEGAKLKLQMVDGSTIAAGSNSRITIQNYGKDAAGKRDVALSLASGLLRAVVAPAAQPSRFEVITATGVAAVRSTDWFIEMTKEQTTIVGVLGGKVALTSRATKEEVDIPEHWGSRVIGDKDPVKPRRWADEEFDDVVARTNLE
jgi:hypothetical protein